MERRLIGCFDSSDLRGLPIPTLWLLPNIIIISRGSQILVVKELVAVDGLGKLGRFTAILQEQLVSIVTEQTSATLIFILLKELLSVQNGRVVSHRPCIFHHLFISTISHVLKLGATSQVLFLLVV